MFEKANAALMRKMNGNFSFSDDDDFKVEIIRIFSNKLQVIAVVSGNIIGDMPLVSPF